MDTFILLH